MENKNKFCPVNEKCTEFNTCEIKNILKENEEYKAFFKKMQSVINKEKIINLDNTSDVLSLVEDYQTLVNNFNSISYKNAEPTIIKTKQITREDCPFNNQNNNGLCIINDTGDYIIPRCREENCKFFKWYKKVEENIL